MVAMAAHPSILVVFFLPSDLLACGGPCRIRPSDVERGKLARFATKLVEHQVLFRGLRWSSRKLIGQLLFPDVSDFQNSRLQLFSFFHAFEKYAPDDCSLDSLQYIWPIVKPFVHSASCAASHGAERDKLRYSPRSCGRQIG